jgi:hypothetical protein
MGCKQAKLRRRQVPHSPFSNCAYLALCHVGQFNLLLISN